MNNNFINQKFVRSCNLELKQEQLPEQTKKRMIELSIVLDDWSPIKNSEGGVRYREKLANNVFDYAIPLEKQKINSYLDHKISIEHLLASTKNKTMEIIKKDNVILAKIPVDETNQLLKKTADLIQQGVIESNSFIFKAEDVEINRFENNPDVDLEVIFTKAKLISIDPVHAGFYPQATCQVYDENSQSFKNLDLSNYLQKKENNLNMNNKENLKVEENTTKNSDETATDEVVANEENTTEEAKIEVVEVETKKAKIDPEDLKIAEILEKKSMYAGRPTSFAHQRLNYNDLKTKFMRKEELTPEEAQFFAKEQLKNFSQDPVKKTIFKFFSPDALETLENRALDGTTPAKGLAMIESPTKGNVLSDWQPYFPELTELARIIPLEGLNTVRLPILVNNQNSRGFIPEGAESSELVASTFTTTLEPKRQSYRVSQNRQLTSGSELLEAQTLSAIATIKKTLRQNFYENLLSKSTVALNIDDYNGGVRSNAAVLTKEAGKVTLFDVDDLISRVASEYGETYKKDYIMAMSHEVYNHLLKSDKATNLLTTHFDTANSTYRGVKIIITDLYPVKEVAKDKAVVTLFTKQSVTAYGCNIVVEDNLYSDMSRNQISRFVSCRGEIKMTDPNIHTRFLKVK